MKTLRQILSEVGGHLRGRRLFVIAVAIVLIVLGAIGFMLPLIPGVLMWLPGLLLLSIYSPTMHAWLKRTAHNPRWESRMDRTRNWLIRRLP